MESAEIPVKPDEGVSPSIRAQLLATEHWSLLASRSTTQNELLVRIAIFLTLVSASVVSLALVGQATDFDGRFDVFTLVLFSILLLVGTLTLLRVLNGGEEDLAFVIGMNRLRAAYTELDPGIDRYFVASRHDDDRGIGQTYAYFPHGSEVIQPLASSMMFILVVDAVSRVSSQGLPPMRPMRQASWSRSPPRLRASPTSPPGAGTSYVGTEPSSVTTTRCSRTLGNDALFVHLSSVRRRRRLSSFGRGRRRRKVASGSAGTRQRCASRPIAFEVMWLRGCALFATIVLLGVASGCDGASNADTPPVTRTASDNSAAGVDEDPVTATTDSEAASLSAVCRGEESRLRALAEQASLFEEVHSVTETPASILAAITARAADSRVHPDDCVALIKAHALRRSGCHPGVRTYPWMGCDFTEDRRPGS